MLARSSFYEGDINVSLGINLSHDCYPKPFSIWTKCFIF